MEFLLLQITSENGFIGTLFASWFQALELMAAFIAIAGAVVHQFIKFGRLQNTIEVLIKDIARVEETSSKELEQVKDYHKRELELIREIYTKEMERMNARVTYNRDVLSTHIDDGKSVRDTIMVMSQDLAALRATTESHLKQYHNGTHGTER